MAWATASQPGQHMARGAPRMLTCQVEPAGTGSPGWMPGRGWSMASARITLVLLTPFQTHCAGQPPAVLPRQGGVAQVDVVAPLDGELQLAGILVAGGLAQLDAAVAFGMGRRHDIQQQSGRQRIEIAVQLQTDPAGDVIDA